MNDTTSIHSQLDEKPWEHKYKLIDFLIKRLEHTITHTQTATKLIYLVNAAILAAVYFEFAKVRPISFAFLIGGILTLLLCIINYLHANFIAIQSAWYRTIDQEIRDIFISLKDIQTVWPKHLGDSLDDVLKIYATNYRFFMVKRSQKVYVSLHLIIAIFLMIFSCSFFYLFLNTPNISIIVQ